MQGCVFATAGRDRSPHSGWRRATGPASRKRHARVLSWPPPYTPYRAARRSGIRTGPFGEPAWGRGRARQRAGQRRPPTQASAAGSVRTERVAACPTAATRPPGGRTRNQRPAGRFPA
ncbi:hypothetical protein OH687_04830 [Burkholderia anthina]|nr:hypothetical protein OH687_04830 [Burkholderia anthina]